MDQAIRNLANIEEIEHYEQGLQNFLNGAMDIDRFTAMRLQQGIYGQRQNGVNMARIKLPGGELSPRQLTAIAEALTQYSQNDVVHVTTRQDIQMHYIPLEKTSLVMRHLAAVGVTTREACGNTIRNITACPLAGVCAQEHVNIQTHVDGAVDHFLRNPLNQQMPRKFKVSFSGCEADCAQGMLHDLGVVAIQQNGQFGFKVLAGGGLGHKPHEAIVIEPFIPEKDLLKVMEAVISLHNRYSDRVKRAKSRIKFLVDRFGPEGFIEKYREELARTSAALAETSYPQGEWRQGQAGEPCGTGAPRRVIEQRQKGLYVFPISLPLGDITAPQMHGLANLMDQLGLTALKTTQDQNLMILNVAEAQLEPLRQGLKVVGLHEPIIGDNVVACPGTSTCRLGITSSMTVAPKLKQVIGGDLKIRVSGCHNGCAQPEVGDIGIYGEGKRMHGKLVPHYQTYFGGDGRTGFGFGFKGPSIPTARIETAINRVRQAYQDNQQTSETFYQFARRVGADYFTQLLNDLTKVEAEEVANLLKDHGDEAEFRVLQLGGGECAGIAQVQVASCFFDAAHERNYRDAFVFQRKYADAAHCGEAITTLVGQALLQISGNPKQDSLAEIGDTLKRLPGLTSLADQLSEIQQSFAHLGEKPEAATLTELFSTLDDWTTQAAEFCLSRDPQLDLSGALPHTAQNVVKFYPNAAPTLAS